MSFCRTAVTLLTLGFAAVFALTQGLLAVAR